jgi:hypothetical protein
MKLLFGFGWVVLGWLTVGTAYLLLGLACFIDEWVLRPLVVWLADNAELLE